MSTPSLPAALRDRLRDSFGCELPADLETAAAHLAASETPEEFFDGERGIHEVTRSMGDLVTGTVLQYLAEAPSVVEPARATVQEEAAASGVTLRSNGRRSTGVQLLGGSRVKIRTLRLAQVNNGPAREHGARGPGGSGVYPVLAQLGITGLATPALAAEVAREVVESASFHVARSSLRERGLDLSHGTLRRLTYLVAERALAARGDVLKESTLDDDELPDAGALVGKRVVVSVDGGRLRVRQASKGGRRNARGGQKFKAPWKEPKVLTIYVADEQGRRDEAIPAIVDATLGDANDVTALIIGYLRLHGAQQARSVLFVGDGASWIWARASLIRDAVGIPEDRFVEALDFFHAVEHLGELAQLPLDWVDGASKTWVRRQAKRLKKSRLDLVLADIDELARHADPDDVAAGRRYFDTHAERMDYKTCIEEGLPIGSGAVESAVRRVVNLRLKANSSFWLEEHAEGVLHLRAQLKAGRWDETMRRTMSQPVWTPPKESI